jgi:uncharacterized protein
VPENSQGLHEPADSMSPETIDKHRAIASLMEEYEAVDWYQQRVETATDQELASILAHNRDEEKEHASMVLEWLRRHDAVIDQQLRAYLFTTGSIVGEEKEIEAEARDPNAPSGGRGTGGDGSLGIGSLRGSE